MQFGKVGFLSDEFVYLERGADGLPRNLRAGTQVLPLRGRPFDQPILVRSNFIGFTKAAVAKVHRQRGNGDPHLGPVGVITAPRFAPLPWPWRDYRVAGLACAASQAS